MNNPMLDQALRSMYQNPTIAQSPLKKSMLDALLNHDAQAGQRIAQNLCQSYGVTEEQAVSQAHRMFGI